MVGTENKQHSSAPKVSTRLFQFHNTFYQVLILDFFWGLGTTWHSL